MCHDASAILGHCHVCSTSFKATMSRSTCAAVNRSKLIWKNSTVVPCDNLVQVYQLLSCHRKSVLGLQHLMIPKWPRHHSVRCLIQLSSHSVDINKSNTIGYGNGSIWTELGDSMTFWFIPQVLVVLPSNPVETVMAPPMTLQPLLPSEHQGTNVPGNVYKNHPGEIV